MVSYIAWLFFLFLVAGCLDPYARTYDARNVSMFFVDGSVETRYGLVSIVLSRGVPLSRLNSFLPVSDALVVVEYTREINDALKEVAKGEHPANAIV